LFPPNTIPQSKIEERGFANDEKNWRLVRTFGGSYYVSRKNRNVVCRCNECQAYISEFPTPLTSHVVPLVHCVYCSCKNCVCLLRRKNGTYCEEIVKNSESVFSFCNGKCNACMRTPNGKKEIE
jgi:hypothetical protein